MSTLIILASVSAILVCLAYGVIIILFTVGWFRLRNNTVSNSSACTRVSVIIAARNEEANIGICLKSILKQDYPSELFEIIVVDDHSTDNTVNEINKIIAANNQIQIRLLQLTGDEEGKKAAITKAVSFSANEWIVTTDADCIVDKYWLSSLMAHSVDSDVQMLMAAVVFKQTKIVFGKLQELEFLSLIASSAGAVSVGLPIMCNSANLAYRREAFEKAGGYISDKKFASGDDIFLMMKIRKMYGPRAISFIKSPSANVFTESLPSLGEFLNQRLRWVSKSKGYKDPWIVFTSVIVFSQSLIMLMALIAWAIGLIGPVVPLLLFAAKFLADLPIMTAICSFTKRSSLMIWFIPLQFIYPVYIVAMGVLGNIISFKWKDRRSG